MSTKRRRDGDAAGEASVNDESSRVAHFVAAALSRADGLRAASVPSVVREAVRGMEAYEADRRRRRARVVWDAEAAEQAAARLLPPHVRNARWCTVLGTLAPGNSPLAAQAAALSQRARLVVVSDDEDDVAAADDDAESSDNTVRGRWSRLMEAVKVHGDSLGTFLDTAVAAVADDEGVLQLLAHWEREPCRSVLVVLPGVSAQALRVLARLEDDEARARLLGVLRGAPADALSAWLARATAAELDWVGRVSARAAVSDVLDLNNELQPEAPLRAALLDHGDVKTVRLVWLLTRRRAPDDAPRRTVNLAPVATVDIAHEDDEPASDDAVVVLRDMLGLQTTYTLAEAVRCAQRVETEEARLSDELWDTRVLLAVAYAAVRALLPPADDGSMYSRVTVAVGTTLGRVQKLLPLGIAMCACAPLRELLGGKLPCVQRPGYKELRGVFSVRRFAAVQPALVVRWSEMGSW